LKITPRLRADSSSAVDLSNCDREPIHLLGAIQSFGFLSAVSTPDWFVQRVSSNVAEWLKVAPPDAGPVVAQFQHRRRACFLIPASYVRGIDQR
jgi:light-regulated signal transduction histidine kinase (bacteriophytochrome)